MHIHTSTVPGTSLHPDMLANDRMCRLATSYQVQYMLHVGFEDVAEVKKDSIDVMLQTRTDVRAA